MILFTTILLVVEHSRTHTVRVAYGFKPFRNTRNPKIG